MFTKMISIKQQINISLRPLFCNNPPKKWYGRIKGKLLLFMQVKQIELKEQRVW